MREKSWGRTFSGLSIICWSPPASRSVPICRIWGFKSSFAELALPFTFILGIGLFGADALLQRARERGASVLPPLLIFVSFAVFSSASNFNHIYTTFMQNDVMRQTLDAQYARFRDNMVAGA